jgi:hypothetical protein
MLSLFLYKKTIHKTSHLDKSGNKDDFNMGGRTNGLFMTEAICALPGGEEAVRLAPGLLAVPIVDMGWQEIQRHYPPGDQA